MAEKSGVDPNFGTPLATYRPSAAPIARSIAPLFGVVCLVGFPMALWKGRSPAELVQGFVAAAAAFSLLIPFLAVCVRPLVIRIYSTGLAGRSFWGRTSLLPWSQIAGLRLDHSSGLALAIIESTSDAPSVWTRPDVIEDESFQRLVAELGGREHPLVRALGSAQ